MKLTKKLIKSYIPEEFFDGSKLKGISLEDKSYDLFSTDNKEEFRLLTRYEDPLIDILSKHFIVTYKERFWGHYHTYIITAKEI